MSRTFELVCHDTKEMLWIGQGNGVDGMTCFYSDNQERMEQLGLFLQRTAGKALVVMDSEQAPDDYKQLDDEDEEP